jgi:predicted secreted protein
MFEDKRSKRIVLVAHCILNQNVKIDGCAYYPGVMREAAELLLASGCGIVQLACPELMHLGLDRQVERQSPRTIESEDTRVARLMTGSAGRLLCRRIAEHAVYQVQEYSRNGFEVVGMLGINGSPTCGVETIWSEGQEEQGRGVFIQELDRACQNLGLLLPTKGIKAANPREAVATATRMLEKSRRPARECT